MNWKCSHTKMVFLQMHLQSIWFSTVFAYKNALSSNAPYESMEHLNSNAHPWSDSLFIQFCWLIHIRFVQETEGGGGLPQVQVQEGQEGFIHFWANPVCTSAVCIYIYFCGIGIWSFPNSIAKRNTHGGIHQTLTPNIKGNSLHTRACVIREQPFAIKVHSNLLS